MEGGGAHRSGAGRHGEVEADTTCRAWQRPGFVRIRPVQQHAADALTREADARRCADASARRSGWRIPSSQAVGLVIESTSGGSGRSQRPRVHPRFGDAPPGLSSQIPSPGPPAQIQSP